MRKKNTAQSPSSTLAQKVKAHHYFSLAFGSIIGIAWIVFLGVWLEHAGPLGSMIALASGGLLIILVGLCYAEMATVFPVSGGEVAYAYGTFGIRASYITGWFLALAYISITSFEAISTGWVLGALLPGIEGNTLYVILGARVQLGGLFIGLAGMILITCFNCLCLKTAAIFQEIITFMLIIISLIFVFAGISSGKTAHLYPLFSKNNFSASIGGILAVFIMTPLLFSGFNVIPQTMEEKAERTSLKLVGKILILSIGAACLFYLLIILSSSMATPWEKLIDMELPAVGAFESAFQSTAVARLVLLCGLCGIITTWNTIFISSTRIIFALGRAHIIPPIFGRIHKIRKSPVFAVLFVGFIGSIGVFLGKAAITPIANIAGGCFALAFLLTCLGVIRLRKKNPELKRPYKTPGGKFTAAVGAVFSLFILFLALYQPFTHSKKSFPVEWMVILIWSALGIIFWITAVKMRSRISEKRRRELIIGDDKN